MGLGFSEWRKDEKNPREVSGADWECLDARICYAWFGNGSDRFRN